MILIKSVYLVFLHSWGAYVKQIKYVLQKKILFVLIFCWFSNIISKVDIYIYSYNRPDFLDLQLICFKKFLKDVYTVTVFNDATDTKTYQEIKEVCKKHYIKCVAIPQKIHDLPYLERNKNSDFADFHHPSVRNVNVVQWSLDNYAKDTNNLLILLDSDIFLIKNFSFEDYVKDYDIAAYPRFCTDLKPIHICKEDHPKVDPFTYLWIGLVFLKFNTLPNKKELNFNCGIVNDVNVDSGGYTYHYLKDHPEVKVKYFDRVKIDKNFICDHCKRNFEELDFLLCNYKTKFMQNMPKNLSKFIEELPKSSWTMNVEFYLNYTFLHYKAGGRADAIGTKFNELKAKAFKKFFETLLNQQINISDI